MDGVVKGDRKTVMGWETVISGNEVWHTTKF